MTKRLMCIIISVLMIVSLLPTGAFADSSGSTDDTVTVTAASTTDDSGTAGTTTESVGEEVSVAASNEGETTVAKIGSEEYTTLASAVEAVTVSDQTTITLTADTTESASITVASGKNIVLDLNGKTVDMESYTLISAGTLTIKDSTATADPVVSTDYSTVTYTSGKIVSTGTTVCAQYGGTVTLTSGTLQSTRNIALYAEGDKTGTNDVKSTVTVTGGYVVAQEYAVSPQGKGATVIISGGVIVANDNAVIGGNGTNTDSDKRGGTYITISGGTLIGHIQSSGYVACGIYHPQSGTLTITGGTIYADGGCGILMRGGTLDMSGGTIITTAVSSTGKVGDSRVVVDASGIIYDLDSGYYDVSNVDIDLSGVNITSANSAITVVDTSDAYTDGTITVSSGTYLTTASGSAVADTSVSSYLTSDVAIDASTGTVASTSSYVASLTVNGTTTYYSTLAAAIAAVPVGTSASDLGAETTITILCNIDDAVGVKVPSYVNLTIDFNNTTYTLTGPGAGSSGTETQGFQLLKDSTIVMKNGTIKIAEDANNIKRIIQSYANVTLTDMIFYSENQVGGENYCLSFNNGSVTITGKTSIYSSNNSTSVAAFDVYYWSSSYPNGTTVTFANDYEGTIDGYILYDTSDSTKATLTINGSGTFNGGVVLSSDATTAAETTASQISISGGIFGNDVSEYCTSTTTALDLDGDGVYDVVTCWDVSEKQDGSVKAYATVDDDGNVTLHIIGTGAMKDYDAASDRPWHSNFTTVNGGTTTYSKEYVTAVEIEDGVTKIGAYAFASLMISHAIIPESVTTITADAFSAARPGTGSDGTYLPVIVYMVGNTSYTPNSTTSEGNVILAYLNGGSLDESTIDGGESNTTLATPTKDDDTFGGWYRNSSFSGTAYETGEKGKVYYAKWTNGSSWDVSAEQDGSVLAYVTLNDDGTTVTLHITGTGAMKDFENNTDRPWHSGFTVSGATGTFAKEAITNIEIDEGITHIGSLAFCSTKVSYVVIPSTVETIGENAFAWVKGYTTDNTNYLTIVYLEGDTEWTLSDGETAYVAQAYLNGTSLPDDYTVTSATLPTTTLTGSTVMGWYTDTSASGDKVTTAEAGSTYYACVAVASITSGETTTYYTTLSAAISAASSGDTVTLLADTSMSSYFTVGDGKSITLDLGGHTLTAKLNVINGNLTVKNGTITGTQPLNVYGSTTDTANYSVLTVESDVTISEAYWGICLFPNSSNDKLGYGAVINMAGTITSTNGVGIFISGNLGNSEDTANAMAASDNVPVVNVTGTINTSGPGVAMNGYAVVNVSDYASITGQQAISVKRGVLNVTGGTLTATGNYIDPATANYNGTEETGAAISVTSTYNYAGTIVVNISGGTITSTNGNALYIGHSGSESSTTTYTTGLSVSVTGGTFSTSADDVEAVYIAEAVEGDAESYTQGIISGGSFSTQVDPSYCATGYAPETEADSETGLYTVTIAVATGYKDGEYVAPYSTFADALGASDIDTIKLVRNVTVSDNSTASNSATLDLNGYDLKISSGYTLTINSGVTIVIEDSENAGLVTNSGTISVAGTLDIRDLAYTTDADNGHGLLGQGSGKISLTATGTFIVPDAWATEWSASLGEWTPNWSSATSSSGIFSSAAVGAMVYCNGTGYECTAAFNASEYQSGTTYWNGSSTYLIEYYKTSRGGDGIDEEIASTWTYPEAEDGYIFAGWYDSEGNVYEGTTGEATAKFVKLFYDKTSESGDAAVINFIGGSLRKDSEGTSSTSLRFGYEIIIPENFDYVSWKWTWSSSDGSGTVNGQYYSSTTTLSNTEIGSTVIRTNLVITGIPSTSYKTSISSTLIVTLVTGDGTTVTITGSASSRSVYDVAYSIANDSSLDDGDSDKTYASSILDACSGS